MHTYAVTVIRSHFFSEAINRHRFESRERSKRQATTVLKHYVTNDERIVGFQRRTSACSRSNNACVYTLTRISLYLVWRTHGFDDSFSRECIDFIMKQFRLISKSESICAYAFALKAMGRLHFEHSLLRSQFSLCIGPAVVWLHTYDLHVSTQSSTLP